MGVKKKPSCMASLFWFSFKLGILGFLFVVIVGAGIGIGVFKSIEEQLPKIRYDSYRPDLATKVFDCNDNLIAELHAEEKRSTLVKYENLPKHLVYALVSIEDERFFSHYGLDLRGILRAIYVDVIASVKAGRIKLVQGASTLTQQLARNAFLTQKKDFVRKLKEVVLAIQIERRFTKEEIIELYLNEIFFGHGIYGIHAAAKFYFDKEASDLNIAESAMIAGMIQRPGYYSPYRKKKQTKKRQAVVLKKMLELKRIDKKTYLIEKDRPIGLRGRKKEKWIAPYFITHLRKKLLDDYGMRQVYTGGMKVYTTLDMKMQESAEIAVKSSFLLKKRPINKFPQLNCALLAVDPRTGHIKAMVGGRNFAYSKFNRTTQAMRQPGSAFKPIVFATAMDYGIPPNRIFNDEEVEFVNKWSGQVYKPGNYSKKYHGPVLLTTALEHSYNIVAVKLLTQIGIDRVISYAKKLGIKSRLGQNLSLALGTSETTMQELVDCYCVFANQGIKIPSYAIRQIVDSEGNVIYDHNPPEREVISPQTAYVITDMMKGVMTRGTGRRSRINRPCAGKSGTTQGYKDAWFIGYTPQLVAAVQVGNDDSTPLGNRMAGGVVSGPIWKKFMTGALANDPVLDFIKPRNIKQVTICKDSGLIATKYCKSKIKQSFIEGTEPVIPCNLHELIEVFGDEDSLISDQNFSSNELINFSDIPQINHSQEDVQQGLLVNEFEEEPDYEARMKNLFSSDNQADNHEKEKKRNILIEKLRNKYKHR